MKKIKIFPSLIAADILNLEQIITLLEPHCDGFHIDVMDNNFVPNLTWGPMFVNQIAQVSKKPLFVHLMVEDPLSITKRLHLKPESIISFHIERNNDFKELIKLIKEKKLVSSLAISPKTSIETFFPFANVVDQVLLMSVEPGFSGQSFLESSIDRLIALDEYRKKNRLDFAIAMDGGINKDNIQTLAQHGCTIFGIASSVFNTEDPIKALDELYKLAE